MATPRSQRLDRGSRRGSETRRKVHVGVDGGRTRIITAVDATTGIEGDELLLPRLIAEHEGNTRLRVLDVAADTKYGTIDNYQWLDERGVRAAIPFSDGGGDHRTIPRSAVAYDAATDTSRCPTGAILMRQGRTTTAAAHPLIDHRPRPAARADCPLKARCCGTAKVRSVLRPDDGGLRDRTVAYLRTRPARRLVRQRKAWVEAIFGDGEERRGLRRARCRGLDAVRIRVFLTAPAHKKPRISASIALSRAVDIAIRRSSGDPSGPFCARFRTVERWMDEGSGSGSGDNQTGRDGDERG